MSRSSVFPTILAVLCIGQLALCATRVLRDESDGVHIVRDPSFGGHSEVWQTFDDGAAQQRRTLVRQQSGNDFIIGLKRPGSVLVKR